MPACQKALPFHSDLFEKTVLKALQRVKNGSITVIKQDGTIIQVNISENLDWAAFTEVTQPGCEHLRVLA